MVCLVEQLACSTAEGSRMRVDVRGNFPLVLIGFKQNWNELRNFSKYQSHNIL
jgi:hypothetical protein